MKKYITWEEIHTRLLQVVPSGVLVYGVPKGGMIAAGLLESNTPYPNKAAVILDDVVDSGETMAFYKEKFPNTPFVSLFDKRPEIGNTPPDEWLVFPWEADHPMAGEDSIHQNIARQLQYIGEDPKREGLLKTPERIVRSFDELYAGYNKNPADLLTTFESDGYDQMVLLRDIELFSMCEHHMLPFYGKAHVAYIPTKRVIGISKLARLVDVFARRLQIQERIGEQVTTALMEHLQPLGAACIIEATHMCMRMRGCSKQNSTMITSSLKGVFLENTGAREELMGLIR